jgi:hypothetical protein
MKAHQFSTRLGQALSSPDAARAVRRLLHEEIARAPAIVQEEHGDFPPRFAERLDAIGDLDERLLEASWAVHRLLLAVSSGSALDQLFDLVVEGPRLHRVLQRHLDGRVSRTQFLGFIAEQHWRRGVQARVADLTRAELERLRDAIYAVDIARLELLLVRPPDGGA